MGWRATKRRILSELYPSRSRDYEAWLALYGTLTGREISAIRAHIGSLAFRPRISIVMYASNTPSASLRVALNSVIDQCYPDWELCVVDDASTETDVAEVLKEYTRRDTRIKTSVRHHPGGVAKAGNTALELVTGDFVAVLGDVDVLANHALYMVAVELNEHPEADLVYSDEDGIDASGRRHDPRFKPDWNLDLFCARDMIGRLAVYRVQTVREVGGFREGLEEAQDHDLALRVAGRTTARRIRHIPHVLYHRRDERDDRSSSDSDGVDARDQARRAIVDFFVSRGDRVEVLAATGSSHRVVRTVSPPAPGVSLIVPTRDCAGLLTNCVQGLLEKTNYRNVEVIIVDNDSVEDETIAFLETIQTDPRVKVVKHPGPFNFSTLCNIGVGHCENEITGFINNDVTVDGPDWLTEMVSHAVRPEVGAVGAKLLYPDSTVQHGGIITGIYGVAGHAHRFFPRDDSGYGDRLQLIQNVSCVTAACMVMRRSVFQDAGGFDERNLAVVFNDLDLCLRLREQGYLIVWTPYAELYHAESASRATGAAGGKTACFASEVAYMKARWGETLDNDPYYNPNLTLDGEDFGLAFPSRARRPWFA